LEPAFLAESRSVVGSECFGTTTLPWTHLFGDDPTRINLIGVQFTIPLPVLNTHRGEIYQRVAERTRAAVELRQAEVTIEQDLAAALARLNAARRWVETYRNELLPDLQKSLDATQKLLAAGEPSVDVLRILDVRRKVLKARDAYPDAIYELRQARDDLSAAVGDVALPDRDLPGVDSQDPLGIKEG
jgi:cobalt-zinc-cadmium efflux system outer membrane protein